MRRWLPLFCLLLAALFPASAQEPFADTFKPTFSFTDNVTQIVRRNTEGTTDPEDDFFDEDNYDSTLIINAKVPMGDINLNGLTDEELLDLSFVLEIGNLSLETTLAGGDESLEDFGAGVLDRAGRRVTLEVFADDAVTFDRVRVGDLTVRWNATEIIFLLQIADASDTFSIQARALADSDTVDPEYDDVPLLYLEFADHALDLRTTYVTGMAEEYEVEPADGEFFDGLARIRLAGRIDSTKPNLVSITNPPATAGTSARNPITEKPLTLRGLARDDRSSSISRVTVQIDSAPPIDAILTGTEGDAHTWALDDVVFAPGRFNTVTVTAHDQDGNSAVTNRNVFFSSVSTLTVTAAGPGGGRVTSDFFAPLILTAGGAPVSRSVPQQEGEAVLLTATPAAGFVFDGWTSVPAFLAAEQPRAGDLRLRFTVQPNQVVTARFIPNPFLEKKGIYTGLIQSSDALDRGTFALNLTASGAFSGTVRIGRLVLPLRGRLTNDLQFSGVVRFGRSQYSVSFALQVLASGARQLTGSVSGVGLSGAITADLATFHLRRNPAVAFAGAFNVLLPPTAGNADAKFPVGIGFGRVLVSRSGGARFIGKLGDASVATAGAALSQDGAWPLFIPLYGRAGSLSGRVRFDSVNAAHDLSGVLDWFRPGPVPPRLPRGVHGDGFSGQSDLVGARFARPAAGLRLFLNPTGAGVLSLDAPAVTGAAALASDDALTLDTANRVTVADATKTVRIDVRTGLFSGTFLGATQRPVRFAGIVAVNNAASPAKVNAAGGFFIRGNRTGAVQLTAPPAAE